MTSPKVAIIILHWGEAAQTLRLLESLKGVTYPDYHVYLVDQTLELDYTDGGKVELIRPLHNLGYSGGNNMILARIADDGYDYALLLNNDTEVEPDFLQLMVAALEAEPRAAAAGPTILYAGTDEIWYGGGTYFSRKGSVMHDRLRQRFVLASEPHGDTSVSFITGCSILMRMKAVSEIGLLDDRYFVYWEDADWSVRAQAAGWSLRYVPRAVVHHHVSSALSVNSPSYLYYIFRNNLLFIRKHVAWPWKLTAWLDLAIKVLKESIKLFLRYKRNYAEYTRMIWRAYYDNARRRYGKL